MMVSMKVVYDKETDSLTITLRDECVKESDEILPGVHAGTVPSHWA